jgi:hypothetical protein
VPQNEQHDHDGKNPTASGRDTINHRGRAYRPPNPKSRNAR